MAAPVPSMSTENGVRTWRSESLGALQAMTTAFRGPNNEVLHGNDEGWVYGAVAAGGSGWTGVPCVYLCSAITAVDSTWGGKPICFPGVVIGKIRETFSARRTTTGTAERWHKWQADSDAITQSNTNVIMLCDAGGKITDFRIRSVSAGGAVTAKFYVNGAQVGSPESLTSAATTIDSVQPTDWVWSAGDYISISTTPAANMGNTTIGITAEFDWGTI